MKKLTRLPTRFKGMTLGLDLHTRVLQYCLLDEQGDELVNKQIGASQQELLDLIELLKADGKAIQVVVEASGSFLWAFDLLVEKLGRDQVHVAAPSRVKVIANSMEKNDENDAWWLAYLLFEGRLPEAMVAEGDLRELRIASRELRRVTDERSDLMRRLRSHLRQLGINFTTGNWESMAARQRVADLVAPFAQRKDMIAQAITRLWHRIQQMDEEVDHWRVQLDQQSKVFDELSLIEQTFPGVGSILASVVWSELGDPRRYHSAKAYGKATGLTPGYRQSAGRTQGQKMTRQGSALVRWALTRAIIACMRCRKGPGLAVRQWVERMSRRKTKKEAIVNAARKLAEGIWRLFQLGEVFDPARAFGGPAAS